VLIADPLLAALRDLAQDTIFDQGRGWLRGRQGAQGWPRLHTTIAHSEQRTMFPRLPLDGLANHAAPDADAVLWPAVEGDRMVGLCRQHGSELGKGALGDFGRGDEPAGLGAAARLLLLAQPAARRPARHRHGGVHLLRLPIGPGLEHAAVRHQDGEPAARP
jgi:hypothetical protein